MAGFLCASLECGRTCCRCRRNVNGRGRPATPRRPGCSRQRPAPTRTRRHRTRTTTGAPVASARSRPKRRTKVADRPVRVAPRSSRTMTTAPRIPKRARCPTIPPRQRTRALPTGAAGAAGLRVAAATIPVPTRKNSTTATMRT